jgi:hypothetical protein
MALGACGGGSSENSADSCVSGIAGLCATLGVGSGSTTPSASTNLYTTAPEKVSIAPGTSAAYTIGGGSGAYTATSSDTTVATVSVSGNSVKVVGIGPGTANIAITDAAGGKVSFSVATTGSQALFTTAPTQVSITPGTSAVYAISGGSGAYTATSSNTSVATASVSGNSLTVAGIAPGTTNVVITDAAGGKVTIEVATTSSQALFTTAPSQVSITSGTSAVYAISGGNGPYSATSSDTSVAKVQVSGNSLTIASIASGNATIQVKDSAGQHVEIQALFETPLFVTAPTDITLPYAGAASYVIAGGVPPYTASSSSPTVVAASVIGTSLNISTLWQQASSSTPTVVTVIDAKGHRVQTNVTVLGMGQSGSIPAILPASITVSDCTTNIPFVFFGGTPPFKVYSGDSVHVPVSAPLPFGVNSYFTASIRNPEVNRITGTYMTTLTVLDSQSKTATAEVLVPSSLVCPKNPLLEVAVGSNVAKETERISFQITGSASPYTITASNYQLPNDPNKCPLPTTDNPFPIVSGFPQVIDRTDDSGQFSFIATAAKIPELHNGKALICTVMLTVTGSDKQQKNVVLTVYPIAYPQSTP